MNNNIKLKFANALMVCLKTNNLNRITVTMIVKEAKSNRQTFYRHFKDKYNLVNWYFEQLVMKSFVEMGLSNTLYLALIKKFNFIKKESLFFYQAFSIDETNSLRDYDYNYIYNFYAKIIEANTLCDLKPDVAFLLKMYCEGSIAMTIEWVKTGMKRPPEELAKLLIDAMPAPLIPLLAEIKLK